MRTSAASGFCDMLRRDGCDPGEVLGRTGLHEEDLASSSDWLPLSDYCGLLEQASAACGSVGFGLKLGVTRNVQLLGELGLLATSAPTLRAALSAIASHFSFLQEHTTVSFVRRDRDVVLTYQIRDGHIVRRRQDAELTLGAFIGSIRRCLGPHWSPREVHFEHAGPGRLTDHDALIGGPIYFGQRCNAIVLSVTELDAAMPAPDRARYAELERRIARRAPERRVGDTDFVGLVLQIIRDGFTGGGAGAERVARKLGLSAPALYRRLKACGVEYSELQRDLRLELAMTHVSELHLPLTEVAFALGYSELSAFSRAFRSWTGMSPNAYRRSIRHGSARTPAQNLPEMLT
ncbi:MAG: AraC family transcriptional regulator [Bradyrhizobium sp.]|nr:AraC family transcriptional regulator [Bradyrhizobium sp.]